MFWACSPKYLPAASDFGTFATRHERLCPRVLCKDGGPFFGAGSPTV